MHRSRPCALVSDGSQCATRPGLDGWTLSTEAPAAAWVAIEADVGGAEQPVAAGLVSDDAFLAAVYDPRTSQLSLVSADGTGERVLRHRRTAAPDRIAFVLCGRRLSALVDTGHGWRVACSLPAGARGAPSDLRVAGALAPYRLGWRGTDTGRAGVFGLVGIRDLHLVQHRDGRPYERDGSLLLTATCAGVGGFWEAHWGVFDLDPVSLRLTQVAHLFGARDGRVHGDHAGQIVVDEEAGTCEVLVSSWGDFDPVTGVHVRRATAPLEVLDGVHVLATTPLPLPTSHSAWDPAAVLIDEVWHVAYVQSGSQAPFDFQPAIARGGSLDDLQAVAVDTTRHQCEGPVHARIDGSWRVLASDGDARRYPAYDLDLVENGAVDAPYGSNIPHPQLAPAADGGTLLVTFDGTPWRSGSSRLSRRLPYGTHGDLVVLHAPPGAALLHPARR